MYVDRDSDGKISGRFSVQQRDGQEYLPDDSTEVTLPDAKSKKREEIQNAFGLAAAASQLVEGVTYRGGLDAAMRMDFDIRIAEKAGKTKVILMDTDDAEHDLLLADANTVLTALGQKTKANHVKKRGLLRAIENAPNETALNAIKWGLM